MKNKKSCITILCIMIISSLLSFSFFASANTGNKKDDIEFDKNGITSILNNLGGLMYSFNGGIGYYNKVTDGTMDITIPITFKQDNKGFAIVIESMTSSNNTEGYIISLNTSEGKKSIIENKTFKIIDENGIVSKTVESNLLISPVKTVRESFVGKLLFDFDDFGIEDSTKVTSINISLTFSNKYYRGCIGNIYSFNDEQNLLLELVTETKLENCILAGDTGKYSVIDLEKNSGKYFEVLTGDKTDYFRVKFPLSSIIKTETALKCDVMVKEYSNIEDVKSIVFDLDTTRSEKDIRCGICLFNAEWTNTWNAARIFISKYVLVGDNGSYYEIYSVDENNVAIKDNRPTFPKGFKGKVYCSLENTNSKTLANVIDLSKIYPYLTIYASSGDNIGAEFKLSNMKLSKTEISNYSIKKISLPDATSRGTVTLSTNINVLTGSDSVITLKPNNAYIIEYLKINGEEVKIDNNSYIITNIQNDIDVEVSFIPDPDAEPRNIEYTLDKNVIVTPDKNPIPNGASLDLKFTIQPGYEIDTVKVNGEEVLLENNHYIINQVESDITVEATTKVIEEYICDLHKSGAIGINKMQNFGSVYADFDSIFVSGKYNKPMSQFDVNQVPVAGIKLSNFNSYDATINTLIVKYRAMSTQVSSYSESGVKIAVGSNGMFKSAASGSPVYLRTNGKIVKEVTPTGGMIFTGQPNFNGEFVIPFTSFKNSFVGSGTFDTLCLDSLVLYNDYKYWSDFCAKYFVGSISVAAMDEETKELTNEVVVWDIAQQEKDTNWSLYYIDNLSGPYFSETLNRNLTADDFVTADIMKENELLFKDFSSYGFKNTVSDLKIKMDERMESDSGTCWSAVKGIRIKVQNDNDFPVPFDIRVMPHSASDDSFEWMMTGVGKVIYIEENNKINYTKNVTKEIPSNFDGYIYIPIDNIVFTDKSGSEINFPDFTLDYLVFGFPTVSASDIIKDGTKISFSDLLLLTKNSKINYEVETEQEDCSIEYILNEGTNNPSNPNKYNIDTEVSLASATKEGCRFEGWYYFEDFSGSKLDKIIAGTYGKMKLYAKFVKDTYKVTIINEEGGKITPEINSIKTDATQKFIVTIDKGYELRYITLNDEFVTFDDGSSNEFTVKDVSGDITIKAYYRKLVVKDDDEKKNNGCKSNISAIGSIMMLLSLAAILIKKKYN